MLKKLIVIGDEHFLPEKLCYRSAGGNIVLKAFPATIAGRMIYGSMDEQQEYICLEENPQSLCIYSFYLNDYASPELIGTGLGKNILQYFLKRAKDSNKIFIVNSTRNYLLLRLAYKLDPQVCYRVYAGNDPSYLSNFAPEYWLNKQKYLTVDLFGPTFGGHELSPPFQLDMDHKLIIPKLSAGQKIASIQIPELRFDLIFNQP